MAAILSGLNVSTKLNWIEIKLNWKLNALGNRFIRGYPGNGVCLAPIGLSELIPTYCEFQLIFLGTDLMWILNYISKLFSQENAVGYVVGEMSTIS